MRRRRRAALLAAFARDWPGGYVLCDGGELAFVPTPLDARGERLLFYGFAAPRPALAFAPAGGVAIDIGANLGEWSVPLAGAVGPTGRVLCIEPNPPIAAALAATLRINNLCQAEVSPVALSDRDGIGTLATEPRDSGLSSLSEGRSDGTVVPLRRLDTVAAEHGLDRLDLVKIDVEGHERQVLHGAAETLRRFRPALVFESGHESLEDRRAIAGLLEELGYDVVAVLHDYGALACDIADYAAARAACAGEEARNLLALARRR
ncbi:MAG: FkbM family methyltransferase [Alphaproteobacteria bacterium]|nr:FkbM family methyltransferase [Alphaproteobacteria bacterium]